MIPKKNRVSGPSPTRTDFEAERQQQYQFLELNYAGYSITRQGLQIYRGYDHDVARLVRNCFRIVLAD